ncbi:MAG TPA: hypothetical protein VFE63_09840 [Roseiarcus sp.]|jgi:hypothetical protein|nr:hypothetical protein [Roseiarcus sp.]
MSASRRTANLTCLQHAQLSLTTVRPRFRAGETGVFTEAACLMSETLSVGGAAIIFEPLERFGRNTKTKRKAAIFPLFFFLRNWRIRLAQP